MLFLFLGEFAFRLLKIENRWARWGEVGGGENWEVRMDIHTPPSERQTAVGSCGAAKGAQLRAL